MGRVKEAWLILGDLTNRPLSCTCSLNMPLQLWFHLTNEWTLGEVMCKFTNYVQGVTIVASILTLTGIAADR